MESIFDKNTDSDEGYRSFKFKRNGQELDFLVERETNLPLYLLKYEYKGNLYFVQSVNNIIESKMKYNFRIKDMKDLIDLKNSNFNF